MKKAELQEIVPELLKFFNDYIYHQFEISADGIPANADEYRITPEHIRLLANSGEKRTACFAEIGLEPFEHTRTTRGETISASDKTNYLILMFYRKIKDENEFARVLFHEAGHAMSAISSPDYAKVSDAIKIDSEEIKTVKLGAMIWSECIAEAIANMQATTSKMTMRASSDVKCGTPFRQGSNRKKNGKLRASILLQESISCTAGCSAGNAECH